LIRHNQWLLGEKPKAQRSSVFSVFLDPRFFLVGCFWSLRSEQHFMEISDQQLTAQI
jgi:hypothetical protein